MANGAANVWTQMNYIPPRGQCNHKASILAAKCPCLRFMLHPLKSSSSYECDGCAHHASFHSMENKAEDEIRKRWELEAKDRAEKEEEIQQRPKKRVRAIEYEPTLPSVFGGIEAGTEGSETEAVGHAARGMRKTRGGTIRKTGRTVKPRAKNGITEMMDDRGVVELD